MKKAFFGLLFVGISAVLVASSDTSAQGIGVGTPVGGAYVGPGGGYGGTGVYGPGVGVGVGNGYTGYNNYGYGAYHNTGYSHHGYGRGWGGSTGYYGAGNCGCGHVADYDDDCDD